MENSNLEIMQRTPSLERREFFKQVAKTTAIVSLGIAAISLCMSHSDAIAGCTCCTGCTSGCRGCVNVR